jgi:spore coat polysaccharide biosynthesis protein SpsF
VKREKSDKPNGIVAIIQARMGSSRLPGKVLLDLAGEPMLVRVVERTRLAKTLDKVIVATTDQSTDDPVVDLCNDRDYPFYRGSQYDVLDRYYQAAKFYQATVIVRITADCPLIDPDVIDLTVQRFLEAGVDFAANRLPPPWTRSYPIGLDTEVCSMDALTRAWREADLPYQREHVMPYLYEQEGRFRVLKVDHEPDYGSMRWTVDTQEDLALVRKIFEYFNGVNTFSWLEVVDLINDSPDLVDLNASAQHKSVYDLDDRADSLSK